MRLKIMPFLVVSAFAILASAAPNNAFSAPILPGFNQFTPPDEDPPFIDLEDSGLGLLELTEEPANTDAIIERKTGLGEDETGTIEIEMVALSLRSVAPVEIGGSLFDLFITLDPVTPSPGELEVITHDADGGTFRTLIDIFLLFSFENALDPNLNFTDSGVFRLNQPLNQFTHGATSFDISNSLFRGVVLTPVPLPAAFPLLLGALAGFGGLGAMKRRKKN